MPIVYADWTASGRMYAAIEERMQNDFLPFVANTHTDNNATGAYMTFAYHKSKELIKRHVGAHADEVIISSGSGMTGVVNKFQRILGLKIHENFAQNIEIKEEDRPIIFITHMEHHSNQTNWLETIADVHIVEPDNAGLVSIENFKSALHLFQNRKNKIAAITSCSNVTGIMTPYQEIAQLMHENNGLCFVDFACSAPYIDINMHLDDAAGKYLDAIYFSPHKFLGGPGSSGILIFNQKLYKNAIPDDPGGGTVDWTNPWGQHKYVDDIESREDGGTPAFLQTIRAALAISLKDEMGVENIQKREEEILTLIWDKLGKIDNIHILASQHKHRLGVVSFYIDDLHYNLAVNMLNDRFGIQTRGGCSCAGTYGHYLLNVSHELSDRITSQITLGNCADKPGWIRMSIHPTQTNNEIQYILDSIIDLAANHEAWSKDYNIDLTHNQFSHKKAHIREGLFQKVSHALTSGF